MDCRPFCRALFGGGVARCCLVCGRNFSTGAFCEVGGNRTVDAGALSTLYCTLSYRINSVVGFIGRWSTTQRAFSTLQVFICVVGVLYLLTLELLPRTVTRWYEVVFNGRRYEREGETPPGEYSWFLNFYLVRFRLDGDLGGSTGVKSGFVHITKGRSRGLVGCLECKTTYTTSRTTSRITSNTMIVLMIGYIGRMAGRYGGGFT